jgi:hypothetical protein
MPAQAYFVPAPDATRIVEYAAAPALPVVAEALAVAIKNAVPVHHGVAKAHYRAEASRDYLRGTEPEARIGIASSRWHFLEYGTRYNAPSRPIENAARMLGLRYEPT